MDWTIILTIVFTGLAAILAAISPFFIAWLIKQKIVQQLHLENLIAAVIPQVVEWVEWWATHWKDPKAEEVPPRTTALPPKGEAKMDKALGLLKTYVPAAAKIPDEILKLKLEAALVESKKLVINVK